MKKERSAVNQNPRFQSGHLLLIYDMIGLMVTFAMMKVIVHEDIKIEYPHLLWQLLLLVVIDIACRVLLRVYKQIWRYGGSTCYIRILMADFAAFFAMLFGNHLLLPSPLLLEQMIAVFSLNTLIGLASRLFYRYAYKRGKYDWLIRLVSFGGTRISDHGTAQQKIKVAIAGAGTVGVDLAQNLLDNPNSLYEPRCFVDVDTVKIGREIHKLPVLPETTDTFRKLKEFEVQAVILAISDDSDNIKKTYDLYKNAGYAVKIYDYPVFQSAGSKRVLREFDIEDLLFRKQQVVVSEQTADYYRGKVVLITGGGGSIGSELCRQLAAMQPKQIVLLDVYENGAYDVQQEMRLRYGSEPDVQIVVASVCSRTALERMFREYHPEIIIHAAAHKHVPLMERDCIEAVENNVFGTRNVLELAEQFGVQRFMMVSTDKAVNPTNVMGATKRMCEMLVLNHPGSMVCSATRFGNVLGSAGSVIPLFKKQIAAGGPITITDKRIIRYFMTIPEAAQLVLQSGAMAKNRELFVLDMGQPVRILDLAENMLRLSGHTDIPIVETGLRPGEKLYEELLVRTEELDKTENELIFIERDKPITPEQLVQKLDVLREAVADGSNQTVKAALKAVVPGYREPDAVNAEAISQKTAV